MLYFCGVKFNVFFHIKCNVKKNEHKYKKNRQEYLAVVILENPCCFLYCFCMATSRYRDTSPVLCCRTTKQYNFCRYISL